MEVTEEETRSTCRKYFSYTLPTLNPKWTDLGANLGPRFCVNITDIWRLAAKRLPEAQECTKCGLTSGLKYEVLILLSLRFKGFVVFDVDGAETIFFVKSPLGNEHFCVCVCVFFFVTFSS